MEKLLLESHVRTQQSADSFVTVQCALKSTVTPVVYGVSQIVSRLELRSVLPGEEYE